MFVCNCKPKFRISFLAFTNKKCRVLQIKVMISFHRPTHSGGGGHLMYPLKRLQKIWLPKCNKTWKKKTPILYYYPQNPLKRIRKRLCIYVSFVAWYSNLCSQRRKMLLIFKRFSSIFLWRKKNFDDSLIFSKCGGMFVSRMFDNNGYVRWFNIKHDGL
jgi:hypothetical protein